MLLSACLEDLFESESGFSIKITNPGDVSTIQTPDVVVNLSGTVTSDEVVNIVTWQNNRGGSGAANGREYWETGNIVLQMGLNDITITAKDVSGRSISRSLTVEREDPTSTDNTTPIVMYSYQSDLSNAAPVGQATIHAQPVFLLINPSDEWIERGIARINYACCKGIAGPGTGDAYGPTQTAVGEPWSLAADLSGFQGGGTRRIKMWAEFAGGLESEKLLFDFTIESNQSGENNAPIIMGWPSTTATAESQYNFRPTASDPDDDTLHFTIQNMPEWASFTASSGRLFGTPSSVDIGLHDSIIISVSDGHTTSSLPEFSITVEAVANGSATLTWISPTDRIDDTPLTNLAGFNVYYGQTSGDYGNKIDITNPGMTTYVVDNLSTGTWYFIVTAYDADGIESNPSNQSNLSL